MKNILAFSVVFFLAFNASAFDRNLTGVWDYNGDKWTIIHVQNDATFVTSDYVENVGRLTLRFSGTVGSGKDSDQFSYDGKTNPISIRQNGELCEANFNFSSMGYMSGDFGGRIIHMEACMITMVLKCPSGNSFKMMGCSGEWK